MTDANPPAELLTMLGGEPADFTVKARHKATAKQAVGNIVFGALWLGLTGTIGAAFIGPVLFGHEVNFTSNGVPMTAGPGNLGPMAMPAAIIGLFIVVGAAVLGSGIYSLFASGAWFAGTATRLVMVGKGSSREMRWEEFTGDITMEGGGDNGSLILTLKTGKMVSRKNGPDQFVPDVITIAGIADAAGIEPMLRKRIAENRGADAGTAAPQAPSGSADPTGIPGALS